MNNDKLLNAYNLCIEKIKRNIEKYPEGLPELPETYTGNYFDVPMEKRNSFLNMYNWTTSFFTGMALLGYMQVKDNKLLKWVNSHSDLYYKKVFEHPKDTMHDLGFLYSLYSVALYKVTGDLNSEKTAIKAADELTKRFSIKGGYINAWTRVDEKEYGPTSGLAIIDTMMNLPLLFWASKQTGNPFYSDIAITHADMVLKRMVREDDTVYHAYKFDPVTGSPVKGCNFCGLADESYWARGTTWAIYGFAIAYRYTQKEEYLHAAQRIAHKFIDNLEADGIPVWDFRLPEQKPALPGNYKTNTAWDAEDPANIKYNRDTSAAAIAACGFMELLKYGEDELLSECLDRILDSLTNERYLDYDPEVPGLLRCSNGSMAYTSFGDYFFMEALARRLNNIEIFW